MFNIFKKNSDQKPNTAKLSLPKSVKVRGYTIHRLPNGKFLAALEALKDVPGELLSACFPGLTPGQILGELKEINGSTLQGILGNLMIAAPKQVIRLVAQLTEIDESALLEDPNLGPDGLLEIMTLWVEVNNLENFIPAVRSLIKKLRTATGSSL